MAEQGINIKDAITGCLAVSDEEFSRQNAAEGKSHRVLEMAL